MPAWLATTISLVGAVALVASTPIHSASARCASSSSALRKRASTHARATSRGPSAAGPLEYSGAASCSTFEMAACSLAASRLPFRVSAATSASLSRSPGVSASPASTARASTS